MSNEEIKEKIDTYLILKEKKGLDIKQRQYYLGIIEGLTMVLEYSENKLELKDKKKKLINTWEESGVLDDLTNETTKSSVAFLMESQASILMQREWNYYFDEGTEVMLDKRILPTDETFSPLKLRQHIGKKGIVKKVNCDLHAYGRGSSYNMDIEFDGELVKNVYAPYIMRQNEEDE